MSVGLEAREEDRKRRPQEVANSPSTVAEGSVAPSPFGNWGPWNRAESGSSTWERDRLLWSEAPVGAAQSPPSPPSPPRRFAGRPVDLEVGDSIPWERIEGRSSDRERKNETARSTEMAMAFGSPKPKAVATGNRAGWVAGGTGGTGGVPAPSLTVETDFLRKCSGPESHRPHTARRRLPDFRGGIPPKGDLWE